MLNVPRLILACLAMLGVQAGENGAVAQQQTVTVPTLSQQIDGARIGWIVNDLQGAFGRAQKDRQPPWMDFAELSEEDALAIAAYLKSLPPVKHAIPGPWGPSEKATTFVYRIVPG